MLTWTLLTYLKINTMVTVVFMASIEEATVKVASADIDRM